MGFLTRLLKHLSCQKEEIVHQVSASHNNATPPGPAKVPKEEVTRGESQSQWSQSEIDVDNLKPHEGPQGVWDGSHFNFQQGDDCDRSLHNVPTSIEMEADDVSLMTMTSSVSRARKLKTPEAVSSSSPQKSSSPGILVSPADDHNKEGQESTDSNIELVLPKDSKSMNKTKEQRQEEFLKQPSVLEAVACIERALQESVPQYPAPYAQPKQRNQLLKYSYKQFSADKAAHVRQQLKGYFRYIPRDTEDNDVSIISL